MPLPKPDKSTRPGAHQYDPQRYQWRFGRMPDQVVRQGRPEASPFRKSAVFVVHGVGEQEDTDTAVSMRWGIENALELVEPRNWDPNGRNAWILPAPYVYDGYWAKYTDLETFEQDIGKDLDVLTARQRQFFQHAWRARSLGWWRSLRWLVAQGMKLVLWSSWWKKPFYLLLTALVSVVMLAAGLWKSTRKFLVRYVNDARLYFEPKGDFEHEMVQLIDRRVGRAFLKSIGLDWEFEELDDYHALVVNGRPHKFDRVVWVAHSLGTVISFNVIGDILAKCIRVRRDYANGRGTDYLSGCPKAERVETALARFITIGSPLDKVCFLYRMRNGGTETNAILRKWPDEYVNDGPLDLRARVSGDGQSPRPWWINCFYGSDPASGPLDSVGAFLGVKGEGSLITNISPFGWRVPVKSHTAYWRDAGFVTKVLEAAYDGFTKPVVHALRRSKSAAPADDCHFVRSWPRRLHAVLSGFGLFWITMLIVALIVAAALSWGWVWPWIRGVMDLVF